MNAFLAAVLTRVMRAAVSIPAVASAFVLHSAAVVGSVIGVVGPFLLVLLRLLLNKHS